MPGSTGRRRNATGRISLDLAPEQRLILEVCRVDGVPGDARLAELLRGPLDWDKVRDTAARHGVFALLHARLAALGDGAVPPREAARLCTTYAAHARRNLLATAHLLKVLKALEARGLPAVPLKGPALAEAAYGDVAMRQFADLDILVRARDVPAVKELLLSRGYEPYRAMSARQEKAHLKRTCELTFALPGRGIFLDIHWRFAAEYMAPAADSGGAFDRRVDGRLQGCAIATLAPDDLLLFLCLHGAFHLWDSLALVSDVARVVGSRVEGNWHALLARAEEARLARALLLGLSLAGELLGARIPEEIGRRAAADPGIAALRGEVFRDLFAGVRSDPGFRKTALFQLRAKDRWRDRLSYCAVRSFLPTVEDFSLVRLPDPLYFLYFLLRPLRLAGVGNAFRARGSANG